MTGSYKVSLLEFKCFWQDSCIAATLAWHATLVDGVLRGLFVGRHDLHLSWWRLQPSLVSSKCNCFVLAAPGHEVLRLCYWGCDLYSLLLLLHCCQFNLQHFLIFPLLLNGVIDHQRSITNCNAAVLRASSWCITAFCLVFYMIYDHKWLCVLLVMLVL